MAKSDADGRFSYELDTASPITLIAWHEEYAPAHAVVTPVAGAQTDCTLILSEGAMLHGKVRRGR